ncbi:MAG: hypothetical protein RLY93_17935 [Sumerlaeia bacterium]
MTTSSHDAERPETGSQCTRAPRQGQGKTRRRRRRRVRVAAAVSLLLGLPFVAASEPAAPIASHRLETQHPALSLAVLQDVVAVSQGLAGVAWYRRGADPPGAGFSTQPDWPTLSAEAAAPYGPNAVFLAGRWGKIRLVRLSPDGAPAEEIMTWDVEGIPTGLAYRPASGPVPALMMVASGPAGISIWQWDDGRDKPPVLRGRFPYAHYAKRIAFLTPARTAVADTAGLLVLGVEDPMRPVLLQSIRADSYTDSLAAAPGGELYAVDRWNGVKGYRWGGDRLTPALAFGPPPSEVATRHLSASPQGLLISENEGGVRWMVKEDESETWTERRRFRPESGPAVEVAFETPHRIVIATFEGGLEWFEWPAEQVPLKKVPLKKAPPKKAPGN